VALTGLVGLAGTPAYYYAEPAMKPLVVRLAVGVLLSVALLQVGREVRDRLRPKAASPFERARRPRQPEPELAPRFLRLRDELAFSQASPNLLLGDEINRATPKTQAALLEAMQEGQVTVEGEAFPLDPPFLVIATQNPIELEGTYPLPEAQLDRLLLRVAVGYPDDPEQERAILTRRRERREAEARVATLVSRKDLLAMQQALEDVFVGEAVERYIVDLVRATREDGRAALGASPRGALALLKLARAQAALRHRDYVTPHDVKTMAVPALAHRVTLRPELWVSRVSAADVVADLLGKLPTPPTETS
jgi:MoxR-like ATPase